MVLTRKVRILAPVLFQSPYDRTNPIAVRHAGLRDSPGGQGDSEQAGGLVSSDSDPAKRQKDEASLRRLASVVIDSNDALTVQDMEGRFEAWNKGAERMYGYMEGEALLMNNSQLVPEGERARALDLVRQIRTGEPVDSLELQRVTKDGRTIDVWLTITKLLDGQKNVVGFATTERDITQSNQSEVDRREAVRVAQLSEFKSQFIAMVAHDLNNVLTPMKINARLLGDELANAGRTQSKPLQGLKGSVGRLEEFLADLLDASRLQSGKLALNLQPLDVAASLVETLDGMAQQAAEAGVELQHDLPSNLMIKGEKRRFEQVTTNLLSNAIKFTPRVGQVKVSLRTTDEGVLLTVADSGRGIAAEDMAKLFQPFGRVGAAPQGKHTGSGLGLFICKGIVEQHGGRMWCESAGPGLGTSFSAVFPGGQA